MNARAAGLAAALGLAMACTPAHEGGGGTPIAVPPADRLRLLTVLAQAIQTVPAGALDEFAGAAPDRRPVSAADPRLHKMAYLGKPRVAWEGRASLFAPVPASFDFRLTIPPAAVLELGAGRLTCPGPDGKARVVVEVQEPDGRFRALATAEAGGEQWQDVSVPLAAYAGRWVILRLRSEGKRGVPAVIGNPVLRTTSAATTEPAPNLLLVVLDTTRAASVGCFGYRGAPTTPNVDRVCNRAVRFRHAMTDGNWTRAAMTALMTGRPAADLELPVERAALSQAEIARFYAANPATWPRALSAAGYAVKGFTDNIFGVQQTSRTGRLSEVGVDLGIDQLFDDERFAGPDAPELTARATAWMEAHRHEPFFLYVHYANAHAPYHDYGDSSKAVDTCPTCDPARPQKVRQYDGGVAYTDRFAGEVFAKLAALDLERRTFVVVMADHGEVHDPAHNYVVGRRWEGKLSEGETQYNHGRELYEEDVHVPLFIAGPGLASRDVDAVIQLSDVAPTLLELLGRKAPASFGGRSYAAAARGTGPAPEKPAFAVGSAVRAVRDRNWKYIVRDDEVRMVKRDSQPVDQREELFDLDRDPGEHENLAARPGAPAAALARLRALAWTRFYERGRGYQLRFQPAGKTAATFEGRLKIEDGVISDVWLPEAGADDVLRVSAGRDELVFRTRVAGRVGALAVRTEPARAPLELEMRVDGQPVDPQATYLGPLGLAWKSRPLHVRDRDIHLVETLQAPEPHAPGVYLWRVPSAEAAGAPTQADIRSIMTDWGYLRPQAAGAR